MAANEFTPGPVTDHVIANVRRLRDELGLSQAQLAARLTEVGRPIRATGLHRLETGKRRIDADDLVGLALAFRVSPIALLLPPTVEGDVALSGNVQSDARAAWEWLRARAPLPAITDSSDEVFARVEFQRRSMPVELRRYPAQGVGLQAIERDWPNVRVRRVADLMASLSEAEGDAGPEVLDELERAIEKSRERPHRSETGTTVIPSSELPLPIPQPDEDEGDNSRRGSA